MRYYEVRESMRAPKTSMPQPESLRQEVFASNPEKARDHMEYKRAFVCDVEIYLDRIDWFDRLLLEGRITLDESDRKSWRKLIKEMGEDGRPYPKEYRHRAALSRLFGQVVKPNAEAYFRDRGYLR